MRLVQSDFGEKEQSRWGSKVGYRTFESEDGDLAVRRRAGEDGAKLVGGP